MSLLGFDALGRWALAQLPSNGNLALQASGQSVAVAGQIAVFRCFWPAALGSWTYAGNPVGLGILAPAGVGPFALASRAAAFVSLQPGLGASFALTGSVASARVGAVAAPGAFALSGGPFGFFVSLASGQGAFASAGGGSTYGRDHEAWVRRPFDGMSWQAEATLSPAGWNGAASQASIWTIDAVPANAWVPAPIESETWTIE